MGYDHGDSFPFDFDQIEFHLVQNRKENCPYDHFPFNVKGSGNIVFSLCVKIRKAEERVVQALEEEETTLIKMAIRCFDE